MEIDQAMAKWIDVQYHWIQFGPIYIGSEYIRKQLPEVSRLFEGLERQKNEFIQEQQANLSVVETWNQPDILRFLEMILRELTVVEKSLYEYLETKRMTFPRFYFVSANDLLDILSKGRNPKKTNHTLAKFLII
jgi:dynein heavy chain